MYAITLVEYCECDLVAFIWYLVNNHLSILYGSALWNPRRSRERKDRVPIGTVRNVDQQINDDSSESRAVWEVCRARHGRQIGVKVKLWKLSFQGEIEVSWEKRKRKCIPGPGRTDVGFGCVREQGGPFRDLLEGGVGVWAPRRSWGRWGQSNKDPSRLYWGCWPFLWSLWETWYVQAYILENLSDNIVEDRIKRNKTRSLEWGWKCEVDILTRVNEPLYKVGRGVGVMPRFWLR